jgi:uncharacterized protein HemX
MGGQTEIMEGIAKIMSLVEVDQTALDTLATSLEAVKTALSTEIASLSASVPQADLSGLNQALTDLQGLEPPAPAPAS